ncbi:hypothetical protein [Halospeciosus flavus]|uniref:Uncharacterized protein n=1 Tax=Halospeciosus flavus TaxID=3032283 RepID=A0ABD5Z2I7_9EURY|nr:hypothetical protein [Halospeciosus flavus]
MVDFSERPLAYLLRHGVVLFCLLLVGFVLAGVVGAVLGVAAIPEKLDFLHSLPRVVELATVLVGVLYAVKVGTE